MKKIITLCSTLFIGSLSFAQVEVTYQVDITDYLAAGNSLAANGIRIGGNFGDFSATVTGGAVASWSPADANSALTDQGNNIWSITVTYPAGSTGTQQYKFVNGDWGMNEGTDPLNTIATGGCGVDDGSGNINRTLEIPTANATVCFVWDACTACVVNVKEINKNEVSVSPNPVNDVLNFNINGADFEVSIFDVTGKLVKSSNIAQVNVEDLEKGTYIYNVNVAGKISSGTVIKL